MQFHLAMASRSAPLCVSIVVVSLSLVAGCGGDRRRGSSGSDSGTPGDGGMPPGDGSMPPGDGSTGTDSSMPPPGEWVDPGCIDGMYTEALPSPTADIEDLVASYSSTDLAGFVDGTLSRRYPVGQALVAGGRMNASFGDCVELFVSSRGTGDEVIRQLSTVVHECGHLYDLDRGGFSNSVYVITPSVTFTCNEGDTTTRGGRTFARSRIRNDAYQSMRPPCGGTWGATCDGYADIYLDGNPDDATFDGGDQGFNSLLEETVQYVNSLATDYAFQDRVAGRISAKDGILTFLWYLGRYLRMARLEYPEAYAWISNDTCWRTAILTVWGRAWLYLGVAEDIASLGISDAALLPLATHPDVLEEIERLRAIEGC